MPLIRRALLLLALAAVTACSDPGAVARREVRIDLRGGQVPADRQVIRVSQGDDVVLRWTTDAPAAIHLHGYDIEKTLRPGSPVEMWFVARATGRFPITLHRPESREEPTLCYLEVHPR